MATIHYMEKKKKPPPGATLISRLRESRLRRDQAIAERQAASEAAHAKHVTAAPPVGKKPPVQTVRSRLEAGAPRGTPDQSGQDAGAPRGTPDRSGRAARAPSQVTHVAQGSGAPEGAPAQEVIGMALRDPRTGPGKPPATIARGGRVDFIHRSISIQDLRPQTDNYDQLTEEIHLSGRFAAAGLIAQGLRLAIIRDANIYKEHHPTFEDYCRSEHGMSATYAYRLIRMAEMAEHLAEEGQKPISKRTHESMPDPFEVMLGLGHRHLLAILPLEADTAGDLLLKGIPVATESGTRHKRIPIVKASEQQIREAVKLLRVTVPERTARKDSTPSARSVKTLADLVELMQEWNHWLSGNPEDRAIAARIGEGSEIGKLTRRFQSLSEKLVRSLDSIKKK